MKSQIIEMLKQGHSYGTIAAELGVTRNVVAGVAYREGIAKGMTQRAGRALSGVRPYVVRAIQNGQTARAAARSWGVSASTASGWSRGKGLVK